jgi:integrase
MPLKIKKRRGSPYWQITGTVAGQLVRRSTETDDRDEAEEIRVETEARIRREARFGKASESTFADACVKFLKEEERSQFDKRQINKLLRSKIGTMKLADIKSGIVRSLANELAPNAKPQSKNRMVVALVQAVINCAAGYDLCQKISIKKFEAKDERVRNDADREWIDAFMAHASPHIAAVALFQFQTGVRTKEAVSLRPDDIRYKEKVAIIRQPKMRKPHRAYLTKEMMDILAVLPPVELKTGRHKGEIRVFGYATSACLREPYLYACKAAGITRLTPYEAGRHSYATECIVRRGVDIPTVAKAGNFSPEVLLRRYAHAKQVQELPEKVFGTKSAHNRAKKRKVA